MKKAFSAKSLMSAFQNANFAKAEQVSRIEPLLMSPNEIRDGLQKLTIQKANQFEFDEMFEEAMQYMKTCKIEHSNFHVLDSPDYDGKSTDSRSHAAETEQLCLSMPFLVAGSDSFRQKLLKLNTDPIFCNLMMSSLSSFMSEKELRTLSKNGKEREISRLGHKIFSSRSAEGKKHWSFIVSGKVKVSLDSSMSYADEAEGEAYELGAGEYFGGFGILKFDGACSHVIIETKESTKLLELSGDSLEEYVNDYEENGKRLLSSMGGAAVMFF